MPHKESHDREFGSVRVFVEVYLVLSSFWYFHYSLVYSFLCLVFALLLVVSVCVSILATYLLLNAEDHRWHWLSFFSSAASSGYIGLYSVYYFYAKTNMEGAVQTSMFFGYVALALLSLSLITGSIGSIGLPVAWRRP